MRTNKSSQKTNLKTMLELFRDRCSSLFSLYFVSQCSFSLSFLSSSYRTVTSNNNRSFIFEHSTSYFKKSFLVPAWCACEKWNLRISPRRNEEIIQWASFLEWFCFGQVWITPASGISLCSNFIREMSSNENWSEGITLTTQVDSSACRNRSLPSCSGTSFGEFRQLPISSSRFRSDPCNRIPARSLPETFRRKFRLNPCRKSSELLQQRQCRNPVQWKPLELDGSDRVW